MPPIAITLKKCVIDFVSECYKTQEMCVKTVDTCIFAFDSIADRYKAQEMCIKAVFNDPFMTKYCLDRYKTQKCVMKPLMIFY